MSLGLDTSVLLRLLVGEPVALATKAQNRLVEAHHIRQAVIISDLVIAEAYHALKHHYGFEPAEIRQEILRRLGTWPSGVGTQIAMTSASMPILFTQNSSGYR
mgnify:CR=1 FL=1